IAAVWFSNGFFCKVLNLVPRHEQIVVAILGNDYASFLTKFIGIAEILMTIWIISGVTRKLNAVAQIIIITTMNIIEFIKAPDLLLWRRFNLVFAVVFVVFIYYNEFIFYRRTIQEL